MLRALLLSLTTALAAMATAQNLVSNPSFEDTTHCVGWPPPQVEALHWYTANTATPDIWNCDLANPCGYHVMDPDDADIQAKGYKYAHDGDRFAGGFHWYGQGGASAREYLTTKLLEPLQAGTWYRVSMWCARPSGVNGAIDHIGVHFGPDSIHAPFPTTLPLIPQARLRDPDNAYLVDTSWVQIVDTIVASGGEQWLIFGTFEDEDAVDGIWLGWGGYPPTVYYYVDLVSVEPVQPSFLPEASPLRTVLAANGIQILWTGVADLDHLAVFDAAGRMVWQVPRPGGQRLFAVPDGLPAGVYLARVRVDSAAFVVRFVK